MYRKNYTKFILYFDKLLHAFCTYKINTKFCQNMGYIFHTFCIHLVQFFIQNVYTIYVWHLSVPMEKWAVAKEKLGKS